MTRGRTVMLGSWCALIGGLCWVVKGGWILATGWQPPVIYEVAPLFLPVAAGALFALRPLRSRLATAALLMAAVAEIAAVLSVSGLFFGPPEWQPTATTVTVLTPLIAVSALGVFVSLVLFGVLVRRCRILPWWSRTLPLLIGTGALPVVAVGGLLEQLRPHLGEASTVVIGLSWVGLSVALDRAASHALVLRQPTAPAPEGPPTTGGLSGAHPT